MNLLIRKVRKKDVVFIKRLEIEAGLSSWSEQDYLTEINRSDTIFFIAEDGQNFCGFILARLITIRDSYSDDLEIEIYNLAVEAQYRRKRIASLLVKKVVQEGRELSVRKIRLEVRKSNAGALDFYTKNSFEIEGERRNFYSNPLEDAVLMSRIISPPKNRRT